MTKKMMSGCAEGEALRRLRLQVIAVEERHGRVDDGCLVALDDYVRGPPGKLTRGRGADTHPLRGRGGRSGFEVGAG